MKICDKKLCCGCGGCKAVCPQNAIRPLLYLAHFFRKSYFNFLIKNRKKSLDIFLVRYILQDSIQ